ncbi:MAG TPA: 8-oxoguanine deaminase [Actinobacteria bacterium]|nr:8-oxoguanine deaminase [Actinomycetota bacterium]
MATLLVRDITAMATMDDELGDVFDAEILVTDGWITSVARSGLHQGQVDQMVSLRDHVVLPGLVNTHHHLYQTLTRAVPAAQDVPLFGWLSALYPIWARLDSESVRLATQLGLVELALSGCTTAFDHQYIFPNGSSIDDQIEAAAPVGIRFHASRGSMSLGESQGGLPPDSVVESESAILEDSQRAVERYHDPEPGSMLQIALAPCSPFSVSGELMRESASLARSLGVRLHTHLAETADEEQYCKERFGARPIAYAGQQGWLGPDVWFAHGVHVSPEEVSAMAETGTGVSHCPTSNMRLASGIAPVQAYLDSGVPVGLGVDGSASNDSSHMLAEVRQAFLVNRLASSPELDNGPMMPVRQAIRMATVGGAAVLGRNDIGRLAPGMAADFFAISLDDPAFAGSLHDPIAAAVLCAPQRVDFSWVHGRAVVVDGRVVGVDVERLVADHNAAAKALLLG